MSLIA